MPIHNTQKIWVLVLCKNMVMGTNMVMFPKKIVYWVLDMRIVMISISNTHTLSTQFLGIKYNFGFEYIPKPRFFCVRMYVNGSLIFLFSFIVLNFFLTFVYDIIRSSFLPFLFPRLLLYQL